MDDATQKTSEVTEGSVVRLRGGRTRWVVDSICNGVACIESADAWAEVKVSALSLWHNPEEGVE